jgi:uncharacterized membrane protein YdbT with pleckstrin-like domain
VPFPKKLLNDYEDIALDLHPHWWFFLGPGLAAIVAIGVAIGALIAGAPDWLRIASGVAIVAALVWFGLRYMVWRTTHFVVTTDRLISRWGVFAKNGIEIPLERINNVNFSQSIWERIIGSGDLVIESAGHDGKQRFADIRKPEYVQNLIHAEMEGNENRKYDRMKHAATPPPPTGPPVQASVIDQLHQLDELRSRGVLTQAEFEAQKAKLLQRP